MSSELIAMSVRDASPRASAPTASGTCGVPTVLQPRIMTSSSFGDRRPLPGAREVIRRGADRRAQHRLPRSWSSSGLPTVWKPGVPFSRDLHGGLVARPAQQRRPIVGERLAVGRPMALAQRPTSSPATALPPRSTPSDLSLRAAAPRAVGPLPDAAVHVGDAEAALADDVLAVGTARGLLGETPVPHDAAR